MAGTHIASAGGKPSSYADGPLNLLFTPEFASPSQILIDPLPDQVGDGSPGCRGCIPKGFELPVGQLYLCADHYRFRFFARFDAT